jgi:hypothetical protein
MGKALWQSLISLGPAAIPAIVAMLWFVFRDWLSKNSESVQKWKPALDVGLGIFGFLMSFTALAISVYTFRASEPKTQFEAVGKYDLKIRECAIANDVQCPVLGSIEKGSKIKVYIEKKSFVTDSFGVQVPWVYIEHVDGGWCPSSVLGVDGVCKTSWWKPQKMRGFVNFSHVVPLP